MQLLIVLRPNIITFRKTLIYGILPLLIGCSKSKDVPPSLPPPTESKSYYISQTGNDNDKGTKEKPFKTLEKLNAIDLEPGEHVYLDANTIFAGTLILDTNDKGSKDKPIIINSYGNGKAIISSGNNEAVLIKSQYIVFSNVYAKGAGRKEGSTTNGIIIDSTANILLEHLIVEGFQKSGVLCKNSQNVELKSIVAKNNGFCGILVTSDVEKNGKLLLPGQRLSKNIVLKDCLAESNAGDPTEMENHSGNGILLGGTDKALIEHCVATNNGWDMPHTKTGPIGIWAAESDSVIIQYCISYKNKTASGGLDGGGFGLDGGLSNSIIQYCLSYDNYASGFGLYQYSGAGKWKNNIIRYNISINDAYGTGHYGALSLWNETGNPDAFANGYIYNNIFYNENRNIINFLGGVHNDDFIIVNNIFIANGNLISGTSSSTKILGNVYWNAQGRKLAFESKIEFEAWVKSKGIEQLNGEVKGQWMDPLLVGPFTTSLMDSYKLNTLTNYKLQPSSPLKNTGLNLQTLFGITFPSLDFFGNKVFSGTAPEPGIHEISE